MIECEQTLRASNHLEKTDKFRIYDEQLGVLLTGRSVEPDRSQRIS
jgi:hypothetical protein